MLNLQGSVELALNNSNLTEALDACLSFDGDKPDSWIVQACTKIAQAYRQQKDFESALSVYKKISLRWPSEELPINCLMENGHALRESGQFDQAAKVYYSVILKQSANGWACLWYARCLVELRQRLKAELLIESFLQNYPSNALPKSHLNIEFCLTLLEISLLERNAGLVERHFAVCIKQFAESLQYLQHKLVVLISKLQDTQLVSKYLYRLLLASWGNEQSIKSIATQFYYIDEPSTCIEALLMLSDLDSQPNHIINLLITCVCETHKVNRGIFWERANKLLATLIRKGKVDAVYTSYWLDCFGDSITNASELGRNANTDIEEVLQSFTLEYWSHKRNVEVTTRGNHNNSSKAVISKRIVYFTKVNASENDKGKLKQEYGFVIERYNALSATSFIAKHFSGEIYKAWRLCRNEYDKEQLFKLCYLVKYGGVFLSSNTKPNNKLIEKVKDSEISVELVKGHFGVDCSMVMTVPNHPLLKGILQLVVQNLLNRSRLPSFYTTGNLCWAKAYTQYLKALRKRSCPTDIRIMSIKERNLLF